METEKRYADMESGSNPPKKGYNIYQARLYSIADELIGKKAFIEREEAAQYIFSCFEHEHDGPYFSRGIIRSIDPILKAWISPWGVDNPKALLYEDNGITTDQWKTTFYEMGDTVILSKPHNGAVPLEQLEKEMVVLNAFYVVVSCHEAGQPEDRFVISEIHRNNRFQLAVIGENREQLIASNQPQPGEKAEEVYKHLLSEDAAETQRINDTQCRRRWRTREGEEMV